MSASFQEDDKYGDQAKFADGKDGQQGRTICCVQAERSTKRKKTQINKIMIKRNEREKEKEREDEERYQKYSQY